MKTVAFIGNFDAVFCSESHYAWTFENKLGWNVIRLQENRTSASEVIRHLEHADLFFWVHTHGWNIPDESRILEYVKERGIPSFSYHLDKYFGIPAREGDYLKHPSFHLDYFFSTDGGNDEGWRKAGINHVYMLPGVVEYGAYLGSPKEPIIDVLFTGSTGYHREYPFRPAMAAALAANYGPRFQVRTGVREQALNDLYASSRVCVGDHIFAGCPRYCSDRLFESVGRGAFLIYPDTPGITDKIPGLVTYKPQDIQDLIRKVDYFLDKAHEEERLERRNQAFEHVRQHGTYTNRLAKILEIVLDKRS